MATGAVLTADIVNSTRLSAKEEKKLIDSLHAILSDYKFEFYRGDSFQVYLKDPSEVLKLAICIRALAKKIDPVFDVRQSIGIGEIETPVRYLRHAKGEAFVLSGRTFDELKENDRRLKISSSSVTLNLGLEVLAEFTDMIFEQMTAKQAEVIVELLNDRTQVETAGKLKKSQGTINKHIQSSGWRKIESILDKFTQFVEIIEKPTP
ncbi:MAG: hypothetical protein ABIR18_10015 [Chitinophagaceae bacterium]